MEKDKVVVIVSLFRNRRQFIDQYINQVNTLNYKNIRVVCAENDSVDNTRYALEAWAKTDKRVTVIGQDIGEKFYGSVVDLERFRILANACNLGFAQARCFEPSHILFIESDLIYQPDLIDRLMAHDVDMVSPMIWTQSNIFYDIWGFRALKEKGGECFPPVERKWYDENWNKGALIEIQSSGSCILFKNKVRDYLTHQECIVGFCKEARARGHKLYVDMNTHIYHP